MTSRCKLVGKPTKAADAAHDDYERFIEPLLKQLSRLRAARSEKLAGVAYMGYASVFFDYRSFEKRHTPLDPFEADVLLMIGHLLMRNADKDAVPKERIKEFFNEES